ncbi:Esterase/lipase superfamily enzyme [Rhodospirillales bacterium URHD0017]|nr:Esterase/lipase superfamily enzyme [Rhodospirillales bacterium URHD0017]
MSDTLRLLLALLELAPQLERLFGAEWPRFRDDLLVLAGRLDREDDAASIGQDLDELLGRLLAEAPPEGQDLVRRAMQETQEPEESATRRGGATIEFAPPPAEQIEHVVVIPVFYGTDRARGPDDGPKTYYTGKRGSPAFGIARVSVPVGTEDRKVGQLTGPAWWRFEFKADAAKHVILVDVQALGRDAFVSEVRHSLVSADARDALVFVHGYNVSFEDAARRAAQISVDLKFPGRTLLYSWASAADPKWYTVDEDTIDWSRQHFEAFLRVALIEIGARDVHVIAHSMGNRALMNTLERLDPQELPPGAATLSQVIFAAPDIGCDKFVQLAEAFRGRAGRCTLYASSQDVALKASRVLHGYPRAGEAGTSLMIVDGIDTIDASRVDTSLVGLRHSYFGSKRSILSDMSAVIAQRLEPDKRFDLERAGDAARRYWSYRA